MKLTFPSLLIALTAVAAFSIGCGKSKVEPAKSVGNFPLPEPPYVVETEPGIPGGRLVIGSFSDPKTFNPITGNENSSEEVYVKLFWGMLGYDWITQQVVPGLAESWSVLPDNKTWTFKLRKGLRWSDGAPLTADDVLFTWNDVIYNTNINNVMVDLFRIDDKDFQVTKIDDLTIKVVTPGIYAPFLEFFGGVPIIPRHVLAKAVAENRFLSAYGINSKPEEIVGNGPFRMKEFKPAQFTLLERNPYFFEVDKKGQRLPYLDNVIFTMVPDMNAMSLRFLQGESDVFDQVRADEFARYKTEAEKGKFNLVELGAGLERLYFWFNQNTNVSKETGKPLVDPKKLKWFRDTKFRQAIAQAVDRDSIVKSVYAGRAEARFDFISIGNKKWHNPNVPQYAYDIPKARALLKEIGIDDRDGDGILEDSAGNPIEFVLNTNTGNNTRDKVALLVQADLKKLGFRILYQPIEFNTLIDKINVTYDYECALLKLGGGATDPASSLNVLKSDGFTHQWFPRQASPSTPWEARLDFLMNAELKTLDFAERKKMFDEIQMIMGEQAPVILCPIELFSSAIRSDIGNVRATALSSYHLTWNVEELYFKKK